MEAQNMKCEIKYIYHNLKLVGYLEWSVKLFVSSLLVGILIKLLSFKVIPFAIIVCVFYMYIIAYNGCKKINLKG